MACYKTTLHGLGKEFVAPEGAVLIATHPVQRTELVGRYSPMERVSADYVMCVWLLAEPNHAPAAGESRDA
jgi:hypothetical protein